MRSSSYFCHQSVGLVVVPHSPTSSRSLPVLMPGLHTVMASDGRGGVGVGIVGDDSVM